MDLVTWKNPGTGLHWRKKRHRKKSFSVLLLFVVCFIFMPNEADAATKTMYTTEQSYAYLWAEEDCSCIMEFYGKDEAVKIVGHGYGQVNSGNPVEYYVSEHFGKKVYIPASTLTSKKPKYSYRTKYNFAEISLKEDVKLYYQPCASAKYLMYTKETLYTVGETNKWYKVFVDGKVCLLRKTSNGISSVNTPAYPEIAYSEIAKEEIEHAITGCNISMHFFRRERGKYCMRMILR